MKQKSNLIGFIDGYQANNINTNISSLGVFNQTINDSLQEIEVNNENQKAIIHARDTMYRIMHNNPLPSVVIELYIKFGNELELILNHPYNNEIIKNILKSYLSIAKIIKDKRVEKIAIRAAQKVVQR
jgi:hypothetical protein